MRYYELISGLKAPISIEEEALISKIEDNLPLNEREYQLAFNLCSRGILGRTDDKYHIIKKPDVWRD